jgi:hypothetical protein
MDTSTGRSAAHADALPGLLDKELAEMLQIGPLKSTGA